MKNGQESTGLRTGTEINAHRAQKQTRAQEPRTYCGDGAVSPMNGREPRTTASHHTHKLNCMKDINVSPGAVKLLESTGEKLLDVGLGSEFLDLATKANTSGTT